jgi:hypothetical protein
VSCLTLRNTRPFFVSHIVVHARDGERDGRCMVGGPSSEEDGPGRPLSLRPSSVWGSALLYTLGTSWSWPVFIYLYISSWSS